MKNKIHYIFSLFLLVCIFDIYILLNYPLKMFIYHFFKLILVVKFDNFNERKLYKVKNYLNISINY